jgi:hypothetical protein
VPQHDSCSHGHVEGVLGAELGDLQGKIGRVHDLLGDPVDLVAKDKGIFPGPGPD